MFNLLFIYTDEQAISSLGAYGNTRIQTPNLDRLASRSVLFERAYVTQTVCTPSRSSLLTGLYPHTNGCTENNIPLRVDTPCLPEMVQGDYVTAHHGKWHLGDEIFAQHGFREWRSIDDGYRKYYGAARDRNEKSTYHHFLIDNGFKPGRGDVFNRSECCRLPEEVGKPAYLAREASRFLRENRDRPFILYVNFFEPHMPYFGPRDSQYDPSSVFLPSNFDTIPDALCPLKTRLFQRAYFEKGHSGFPLRTEAEWRRMIANYWGLASLVDTHAGTILDTLDECGLRDNTIVVYTSDHGDMMGSHRLLAKCVQYEEASRVPLLIRLPGQEKGKRIREPISQIDLVPTLLDLMGEKAPAHLPGRSRRRVLERNDKLSDDVVLEWNGRNSGIFADQIGSTGLPDDLPGWAEEFGNASELDSAIADPVRTIVTPDGWKFTCSPRGEHQLFDLNTDPLERRNLAFEADMLDRVVDLRRRIGLWQDRTRDHVPLPLF